MPLVVRRKEKHIKGKIENLKAEWRVQKNSPEEATGGEGSSWHWFKRMSEILTGSTKWEEVPGEVDMKTSVLLSEIEEDNLLFWKKGEFLRCQCLPIVESTLLVLLQQLPRRRMFLPIPLHAWSQTWMGNQILVSVHSLEMQYIWQMQSLSLLKVPSK